MVCCKNHETRSQLKETIGRRLMPIEFEISEIFPATCGEIYSAWVSSEGHSAMTGSPARASAEVGAEFTAWDGYITGKNLAFEPGKRILQAWRTSEFDAKDADSTLEIQLIPVKQGARLTLHHSNLPAHGMQYKEGWVESYFEPMKAYFSA
jgi:activator of HSP90 ATPase